MTDDPRLEDDVRDALNQMTRDPVPPRLVARVAGIPSNAPGLVAARVGLAGSGWRLSGALAAVFVVVVLVAGAFLLRGTGPGTVASPSPTGLPGTALSGTPLPTNIPSIAPATVPPTAVPPTAPPTAAPGAILPADFQPRSVTFVSPTDGWVLGSTACASARCAVIAHTLDAGHTWSRIPAPATTVDTDPRLANAGVSALRFADPLDGWAYGPQLWATHDGGATWHAIAVAGFTGGSASVWDLEAAAGSAHLAYYASGPLAFGIASTAVARDAWKSPPVYLPVGAGPVPQVQLVIQGTAGWLIQVDREVVNGARLVNGSWQTWTPPCSDSAGPAVLAASSSASLLADCDLGVWSTPAGEHLYRSANGGASFAELSPAVPLSSAGEVATPNTSTIVVAGDGPPDAKGATTPVVIGSFDGGHSWTTVLRPGSATFTDLGFTTQTQGVLITTVGATSRLLMTRDGGHTWAAVAF
jgi:photosystem II stability/assembly factor-like uncharacterized protein